MDVLTEIEEITKILGKNMKLSENWLRQHVTTEISGQQLIEKLNMSGLEVASVEPVAGNFSGLVVGQVESVQPHPQAERLQICQVKLDPAAPAVQIVCGAQNVASGQKVAVAKIGAILNNAAPLKAAQLRTVLSNGMLCSAQELGIAEKSEGILILPKDAPVGEDLRSYLQLNDVAIDLELTPNRGDCLSMEGVAREVAALCDGKFIPQTVKSVAITSDDVFPVTIDAIEACPHYVGRVIKGINLAAQTPVWLAERLRRSGLRSIDPIVDVTNYVMLELGQPLHAFDLAKLSNGIVVRFAKEGEQLTLLDGKTIQLQSATLIIADEQKPLAIAGVMGGMDSGVSSTTQTIFLESAFFAPQIVAGKARSYALHTDSAHRFERGVDPQLQIRALERASELLMSIVGGVCGPIIERTFEEALPPKPSILLRAQRIARVLGITVVPQVVEEYLTRIGVQFEPTTEGWKVSPPSYRFDIVIEEDLIEEIARLVGYENIQPHRTRITPQFLPESERTIAPKRFAQVLVDRDYHEVITYSFVDPKLQALLDPIHSAIALLNPISQDMAVMRTSLWPGLIQAYRYNRYRQLSRLRLFETGFRFIREKEEIQQSPMLAGLCAGTLLPEQWGSSARNIDFFDVKGDIEALLALTQAKDTFDFKPTQVAALHPGQTAQILREGVPIGVVGALHPKIAEELEIKSPVFLFELQLNDLQPANLPRFATLSKYPAIRRDIAVLVAKEIAAKAIEQTVRKAAGGWLVDLRLFDVYQNDVGGDQQKSLALGLTLQHPSRTLVDDEVNTVINQVIAALADEHGALLRE